jgi:hypothetical protein
MARIVDFNVNATKHRPMNNNSCNVVIHNNNASQEKMQYPQEVVYNPPDFANFQSVNPVQSRSVDADSNESVNAVSMEELYKLLALTFSTILKDNNPKLIANIIDNSGKIIVEAGNLIKIIALLTNSLESDIHIEYVNNDGAGCSACAKINPIKKIENIKIGYVDFKLGYNDKYNILSDTFNVSLKKCIIPVGIIYN